MTAVLFIVTIPTEVEETRLKNEFLAKEANNYSDQVGVQHVSSTTNTKDVCLQVDQEVDLECGNTLIETPTNSMSCDVTTAIWHYDTFPKYSNINILDRKNLATVNADSIEGNDNKNSAQCNMREDVNLDSMHYPTPVIRKSWEGLRDILSSSKRKTSKRKYTTIELQISPQASMELVMREIIKRFQIRNAVWTKDRDARMLQICFTAEFNETYECILDQFWKWGIGERENSTVSVMNCIASKTFTQEEEDVDKSDEYNTEKSNMQKEGTWDRFMNTVRSRLNVAQIVRDVRQDASITFDFLILLISAAILASFGLIEDSTIFLASSMLISPLMGPIIAAIFGTVIKDKSLRSLGLKNEFFGILMATLVGFVFGMIICSIDERYGIGEGLTDEMLSRCELHSLLVGVFTAIPSGAAAAIGILGGNIGSLVGVAISASLLPPAVNSGLLWALACIYKLYETDGTRYLNVIKSTSYSNDQATELAILGTISMCLTISNVLCIYVVGIIVLKVKEIAPVISRNNRQFWKHDIKIARNLNKSGLDSDTAIIDQVTKEELKAFNENTWSPFGIRHPLEPTYDPNCNNYKTVHQIEYLYNTLNNQQQLLQARSKNKFNYYGHHAGRCSEVGGTYKMFRENLPRCATMPSRFSNPPLINIIPIDPVVNSMTSTSNLNTETSTPTGTVDEMKRRKFIVTPAEDDPLQDAASNCDIDV